MQRRAFLPALLAHAAAVAAVLKSDKPHEILPAKTPLPMKPSGLPPVQWRAINRPTLRNSEPHTYGGVQCRIEMRFTENGSIAVLQKRARDDFPWLDWEMQALPKQFRGVVAFAALPNVVFPVFT